LTTGCIHDTTGCQTGLTPVWQPVVSCMQTFNGLSTGCISCKRGFS